MIFQCSDWEKSIAPPETKRQKLKLKRKLKQARIVLENASSSTTQTDDLSLGSLFHASRQPHYQKDNHAQRKRAKKVNKFVKLSGKQKVII